MDRKLTKTSSCSSNNYPQHLCSFSFGELPSQASQFLFPFISFPKAFVFAALKLIGHSFASHIVGFEFASLYLSCLCFLAFSFEILVLRVHPCCQTEEES